MNNLILVTPCSRPGNLSEMYFNQIARYRPTWIICHDAELGSRPTFQAVNKINSPYLVELYNKGGVSGNLQRNTCLDYVKEKNISGWLYFLDDDNILHPDFMIGLMMLQVQNPKAKGFIFGQNLPDGTVRINTKENIKVCHIDQAQYCLHTDLIGDNRFIQKYEADGILIESLYNENREKFVISDRLLCYYNYLRS